MLHVIERKITNEYHLCVSSWRTKDNVVLKSY